VGGQQEDPKDCRSPNGGAIRVFPSNQIKKISRKEKSAKANRAKRKAGQEGSYRSRSLILSGGWDPSHHRGGRSSKKTLDPERKPLECGLHFPILFARTTFCVGRFPKCPARFRGRVCFAPDAFWLALSRGPSLTLARWNRRGGGENLLATGKKVVLFGKRGGGLLWISDHISKHPSDGLSEGREGA